MDSFRVLNLEQAEAYLPQGGEVCISITSPTITADLNDGWDDVLRLTFSDIDNGPKRTAESIAEEFHATSTLFTDDMARQVIAFLHKHMGKRFIIHCEAGISRSPAVALALHEVVNGSTPIPLEKSFRLHNRFVRRKILEGGIR